MYMKDNEIVREYREAKDKKEQVKILADMNGSTYDEIVGVLKKKGIDVSEVERKPKAKKCTKEEPKQSEETTKYTKYEGEKKETQSEGPGTVAKEQTSNMAAGLPVIVKDTITQRMIAETEKMEECARQMKVCEQNIKELNAFLQARG